MTRLLAPGLPESRAFPHAIWARHLESCWRHPAPELLAPSDPFGWWPLRQAIAAHLGAWRGLDCTGQDVVITSGAQETFRLIAQLFPAGTGLHVETPCYGPMLRILDQAGLVARPLGVDRDGADPAGLLGGGAARGAVLTPSRQYPLGVTLPLSRRLAMLDWARREDALIIEDDYDSEFRFTGQPLPALASLESRAGGRVIYVGSFSKLLSGALRLSYMVLPRSPGAEGGAELGAGTGAAGRDWGLALREGLRAAGAQASMVPQPALARFIERGEFAAHLRRMRRLYARRQGALLAALEARLAGWLVPDPLPSGLHLTCALGPKLAGRADHALAARAGDFGLGIRALSSYPGAQRAGLSGLVLGYASFDLPEIETGVERLQQLLMQAG